MNKKVKNIIEYIIIIVVVILIRAFIITPAKVDGASMEPTLYNNNYVLVNKLDYTLNGLNRFDIIVIKYNNRKIVKRVIGLPFEYVNYKNNKLYINNKQIKETFNKSDISDFNLESIGYLKIPGDKYFVVGDNRENSLDSRSIGLISKEDIIGKVCFRIYPLNKINTIK